MLTLSGIIQRGQQRAAQGLEAWAVGKRVQWPENRAALVMAQGACTRGRATHQDALLHRVLGAVPEDVHITRLAQPVHPAGRKKGGQRRLYGCVRVLRGSVEARAGMAPGAPHAPAPATHRSIACSSTAGFHLRPRGKQAGAGAGSARLGSQGPA